MTRYSKIVCSVHKVRQLAQPLKFRSPDWFTLEKNMDSWDPTIPWDVTCDSMFQTINKLVWELQTTEDEQLYQQYCSCECCRDRHHDVSTNRLSNYSWRITVLGDHQDNTSCLRISSSLLCFYNFRINELFWLLQQRSNPRWNVQFEIKLISWWCVDPQVQLRNFTINSDTVSLN